MFKITEIVGQKLTNAAALSSVMGEENLASLRLLRMLDISLPGRSSECKSTVHSACSCMIFLFSHIFDGDVEFLTEIA